MPVGQSTVSEHLRQLAAVGFVLTEDGGTMHARRMTMEPARQPADRDRVREAVRSRYGGLARAAQAGRTVTGRDADADAPGCT